MVNSYSPSHKKSREGKKCRRKHKQKKRQKTKEVED
jgi:hypothetical protein